MAEYNPNLTICPQCGKKAIKWPTGTVYVTNPVIYQMIWKCGCGWTAEAESERASTNEDFFTPIWNKINEQGDS